MTTACRALSIRRRRSSSDGTNDPARSLRSSGRRRRWSSTPSSTGTRCGAWSGPGAFVAADAQRFGGLGLDQFLQAGADQFGEHGRHIGALDALPQRASRDQVPASGDTGPGPDRDRKSRKSTLGSKAEAGTQRICHHVRRRGHPGRELNRCTRTGSTGKLTLPTGTEQASSDPGSAGNLPAPIHSQPKVSATTTDSGSGAAPAMLQSRAGNQCRSRRRGQIGRDFV